MTMSAALDICIRIVKFFILSMLQAGLKRGADALCPSVPIFILRGLSISFWHFTERLNHPHHRSDLN
jgi:hypothetical protein